MPNDSRTARKVGIEMEGYMRRNPSRITISGATLKHDASLANGHWSDANDRNGVEVVSRPIRNLDIIGRIVREMQGFGWSVDNRAGTHVHVDIADYTEYDKAKLLRFAKGIERIMYMFVKDYREGNRYAQKLQDDWRKIFKPIEKQVQVTNKNGSVKWKKQQTARVDWERLVASGGRNLLDALQAAGHTNCVNSKYYWVNIYSSRHGTAEFRIFHAIESPEEAMKFAKLAHNIVDLCKHASVEQLEFIIMSLYESEDLEALKRNFFYVLGLPEDFNLPLAGETARNYMRTKLAQQKTKREEAIRARLKRDASKLKKFNELLAV